MAKLKLIILLISVSFFYKKSIAIDKKYIDSVKHVLDTTKSQKNRMYCLYILTYEHGLFDPQKGLQYGNILQREAEASNNPVFRFYAYNGKANCFETTMSYDSMLYYTSLSYELYRNSKETNFKQVALSNLATIHRKMGHYNLALQFAAKADSLVKENKHNPRRYGERCILFLRINNLKKARECINIGLEEYRKSTDPKQLDYFEGILTSHLGLTMSRQGENDSAILTLKKSISILKKETDTVALAEATTFMGEALYKAKSHEQSASYYHLASDYYGRLHNKSTQNFLLIHELRSKASSNNYRKEDIVTALEKAISNIVITQSSNEIRLDLYTLLSDCYEKVGEYKLSLKYSRLYDDLYKNVLDNENRLQFLDFQKSFDFLNSENKISQLNQLNANNSLKLENKNLQVNRYIIIVISLLLLFLVSWILFIQITKKNKALMQAKSELQIREANEKERNRISREMHDDIGARLTQITLMGEHLKTTTNKYEAEAITETSRKIVSSMGEIIWSLNSEYKTLNDLFNYLREQLNKLLEYSNFDYGIHFPDVNESIELSNQQRRNIVLAVKETVNNSVKYSQAKTLSINAALEKNTLTIKIKDDGAGFDVNKVYSGNGLKNIKQRIEEIGGSVQVESIINKGTSYVFTIVM